VKSNLNRPLKFLICLLSSPLLNAAIEVVVRSKFLPEEAIKLILMKHRCKLVRAVNIDSLAELLLQEVIRCYRTA